MAHRRSCKRALVEFLDGNDDDDAEKVYRFQILLPNGISTRIELHDPAEEMFLDEFIYHIRREVEKSSKTAHGERRRILWNDDIYLEDMHDNKINKKICFRRFKTNKCHILRLHDGAGQSVNTFQNMWDLTPDTDLLAELPAEYTFETALADLIDNSLQAVWSNGSGEKRLVSVMINEHKIVIFDSGPGMDGSDENSISKWGRMGSSNHRPSRKMAIGGNAPYLMPFFGMFGYGGPIASMHLGRHAVVSSKTKESKKVYTLHLSRDALLNKSTRKCIWRTDGGVRDPLEEEIKISPHGSFTQVEIQDLKIRFSETFKLRFLLKDIYFPYIQCDEEHTRKTTMPIEFQVNDIDLAEVQGGEVAVTNLHSCHGPNFVLQLHFVLNQENITSKSPGSVTCRQANGRLKCVYFPIVEGKESIERILENLEEDGYGIKENFENFCRVSVRRLGRLLPDARWQSLPFMEAKQRKGDKAQLLKRCCKRVKCFVDTDAGFSPTPSKTDLAHHDPFTLALRSFGYKPSGKESEAIIKIQKDGKPLNLSQLEKEYQDWIIQMHDRYDEEIDGGEDEPVLVISPCNKKKLGITADVVRVHRAIRRKGLSWKSGQKVKILKGAVGCPKNNLYATLEYILVEGFQGDMGGEARLICRPLGFSEEQGCSLVLADGNASLDIHNSLSFPISVIDTGKFQAIDLTSWNCQLAKQKEKVPSAIDILIGKECCLLQIDGELPIEAPVTAGCVPPAEIIAVIRPESFIRSSSPSSLDQKHILKDELEMSMEIKHIPEIKGCQNGKFVRAERVRPSSRNGIHGLYIYSLRQKYPELFYKAGVYIFLFSVVVCKDSSCKQLEVRVTVKPDLRVQKWRLMCDDHSPLSDNSSLVVRVGSYISYLSVACFDPYSNQIPFSSLPEVVVKIYANNLVLAHVHKMKMALSSDQLLLEITDMEIESNHLDMIRPSNEAMLEVSSRDRVLSATVACKIMPGPLSSVEMKSTPGLEKNLAPGKVIDKLVLEMFDAYGNHIEGGIEVSIHLDGLCFQDHLGSIRKVNNEGCVTLSGLLKVAAGYGSKVCLSVFVDDKLVFEKILQVVKRELRVASGVPSYCTAGSHLEDVVFEIFDSDGVVDEAMHGQLHTLTIKSEPQKLDDTIQYTFQHGRCIVPVIPVPQESGTFLIVAFHTHFPDLRTSIEIYVMEALKLELVAVTDVGASIYQSQFSNDRISLLQESSESPSSQMVPSPMNLFVKSIIDDAKKLDDGMAEVGLQIRKHESKLKILNDRKTQIEKEIYDLQVLMGPPHLSQIDSLINAKEQITKQIEGKSDTAAAVFCNLSKAIQIQEPQKHFMEDVVGLVALLGTVRNSKLSRIFAEYLGENCMLAIVCKSYEAASALEKYGVDGKVNRHSALHEAAAALGITINRRFTVICLEEISPYKGEIINNHPQRWLELPNPLLQSGETPAGFMGYAVNMISLDMHHLNTRTAAGYGLRETLFYRLFGKLQVYQTREHMRLAKTCIKHGAISLDGGIMRENGIILLGDCEPEVVFPVITIQNQMGLSRNMIDVHNQIGEKKCLLEVIDEEMTKEAQAHEKDLARFRKKGERLCEVLARKKILDNLLKYNSH